MRWLLIVIFLGVDFIVLFALVRTPFNGFYIDGDSDSEDKIIIKTKELNRNRRNLVYGRNRWRSGFLTKTALTKGKSKPKHPHRHREKLAFILRCPTLPEDEPKITSKIGVEWSLNSDPYLRIVSNGKRFESLHITKVEEWRNINGQLNILAYGPKLENSYDQKSENYRYKFEYEESRGWFALKIKSITEAEVGIWQCKIKLKLSNSTVLAFESRKTAKIQEQIPEKNPKIRTISIKNETKENEVEKDEVIKYSEPPLFSFSKNDGEYTIFSRVDKRRDLLSYVRTDADINKTPKLEKIKRFNYCSDSPMYSHSFNFLIPIVLYLVFDF